jgi:hypothetical protein
MGRDSTRKRADQANGYRGVHRMLARCLVASHKRADHEDGAE